MSITRPRLTFLRRLVRWLAKLSQVRPTSSPERPSGSPRSEEPPATLKPERVQKR